MDNEKFVKDALVEMFRCAGKEVTYEEILQIAKDDEQWYSNNIWTADQEEEFKKWWMKNLKWSKARKEKEFGWFILMYGFRRVDY